MGNKNNKKQKISFLVTESELKLLKDVVYLEPCLVDGVETAKSENGQYRVEFLSYDLEDALNALAYAAGYIESYMEKETLYQLHGKIESYVNRAFE